MLKVFTNTTDFQIAEPTVAAIGKFDGDHRGHQKIFETMRKIKSEKGYKSAVFTFADSSNKQISPMEEKHKLLENEGIDYCIEYPFNEETRSISAGDFLENILLKKLNMKHIVAGSDCSFGHNREGNAGFLRESSSVYHYCVTIVDKVKAGETDISSTYIRDLLHQGRVAEVNELLGHPYTISGVVEEGNQIGSSELGFATANIYPDSDKFIPASGVYAARIDIGDGNVYSGMTNIGTNPSIENDDFDHCKRIETHIFDFDQDIYGKFIIVSLIEFIRPEQKFESIDDLRNRLRSDEAKIRSIVKVLFK